MHHMGYSNYWLEKELFASLCTAAPEVALWWQGPIVADSFLRLRIGFNPPPKIA